MTITHRFVILNREAVKNLRPFLLRAGEDTRPYERFGSFHSVGRGVYDAPRSGRVGNRPYGMNGSFVSAGEYAPPSRWIR